MRKLSLLFLSLAFALGMMPVVAFATPEDTLVDEMLAAQQRTREIWLTNGVSSGQVTIDANEKVDFVFNLTEASIVGFVLRQASSDSLTIATLESSEGNEITWVLGPYDQTYRYSPFLLNTGKHRLRLDALEDTTVYLTMVAGPHETADAGYEVEPNDDCDLNAMPVQIGKTYIATSYDPAYEYFIEGNAQGIGIEDVDSFCFALDSVSDVNIPLVTSAAVSYEVRKSSASSPIVSGSTNAGNSKGAIRCGHLESGEYYLTITGGKGAWTESYAFSVEATPIEITNPTPSNPDDSSNPGTSDPGTTDPQPVGTETMYRLYNPNSGEHFYTSSPVERQAVIDAGWDDEGIGWTAPTEGVKVYRLYNSFAGEHHYTKSEAERDMLVDAGWTWEEGGWYSDPNEAVPLYRAYNPNAYANNHHYTLDWGEFQTLLSIGWQDEGVGWHGVN